MLKYSYIEIFKGTPTCFDLKTDRHQGVVLYLVKVTE